MKMTYLQRADQCLRKAPEYKKNLPSTLFYSMYELRNYKTEQGIKHEPLQLFKMWFAHQKEEKRCYQHSIKNT